MEDLHIISSSSTESPRKKSPYRTLGFLFVLFCSMMVGVGAFALKNPPLKKSVEGVETENTNDSIRFDTPETEITSAFVSPTEIPKASGTVAATKTILLKSDSDTSGFITDEGLVGVHTALKIGDDGKNQLRGFVSFGLDEVPQGIRIQKATLRIYQTKIQGNPFGLHGTIKIDHLVYGDTLSADAYGSVGEKDKFATIPQTSSAGWKEIDVTERVTEDITNARTHSEYRIHFDNEKATGAGTENTVYFESASNSELSGQTPQLVITY